MNKKKNSIKIVIGMVFYFVLLVFHSRIADLITLEDIHIPYAKSVSNLLSWMLLIIGIIGLLLSTIFLYKNNKKMDTEGSDDD